MKKMEALSIANEVGGIFDLMQQKLNRDINSLCTELDIASQKLARSAELLADAQFIADKKRGEVAEKNRDESATLLREIIVGELADENRLLKLCEKLNSALVHRIESIRSILSAEKELSRL